MNTIKKIMALDRLSVSGGKSTQLKLTAVMLSFLFFMGFMYSPASVVICGVILAVMIPSIVFQNEMQNHSTKLWGILPVSRRELVKSRYCYMIALYSVSYLFIFIIMRISLVLKLYDRFIDVPEIMEMIAEKTSGMFTVNGLFYLVSLMGFAVGLGMLASALRGLFKRDKSTELMMSDDMFRQMKSLSRRDKIILICSFILFALFILFNLGLLPITAAMSVMFLLLSKLFIAAHGIPFCAVFLLFCILRVCYHYTCTVLEYDDAEI